MSLAPQFRRVLMGVCHNSLAPQFQYFAASCLDGCLLPDENPNEELSVLTEQLEIALSYSSISMHTVSLCTQYLVSTDILVIYVFYVF